MKNIVRTHKIKSVIAILLFFLMFIITGCEVKQDMQLSNDEFEIRVFHRETGEEIKDAKRYYYDYTGEMIDVDIKIYCNGKEINATTLSYLLDNQGSGSLVRVRTQYVEFFDSSEEKQGRIPPIEKGWYTFKIEFNRNYLFNNKTLHNATVNDFYFEIFIDYDYFMSAREE